MFMATTNRPWLLLFCLFPLLSVVTSCWYHVSPSDLGHHCRSFPKHLFKPIRNHLPGWSPSCSPYARCMLPILPSSSLIPTMSSRPSLFLFLYYCDSIPMIWFNYQARGGVAFFLGRWIYLCANETLRRVGIIKYHYIQILKYKILSFLWLW